MKPAAIALLVAVGGVALAERPERLDALDREMQVLENVFAAALRDAAQGGVFARGVNIEVDYLAEQGALITLSSPRSWFGAYRFQIDADGAFGMPRMVRDILADLQIPATPLDAEELEALRTLREEQRALRRQQREVRREIRVLRREQALSGDGAAELEALQRELTALDAEHEALGAEIGEQYARVHGAGEDRAAGNGARDIGFADVDAALLDAVCRYGGMLKSLPPNERLSVKLRRGDAKAFYVFDFKDVLACYGGGINATQLRVAASVYER